MAMGFETRSRIDVKRPRVRSRGWAKVAFLSAAAFILPVTVVAGAVRFVAARHAMPAALIVAARAAAPHPEPKAPPRPVEVAAPPAVEIAPAAAPVEATEAPRPPEGHAKPAAAARPPA